MIPIGRILELTRYPVKSMAGVPADAAFLGWHGLAGDRRFAFRRAGDESSYPWLSASHLPELVLYHPLGLDPESNEPTPTHVRTPSGAELELRSAELAAEIAGRLGRGVELMHMKHGVFDDGTVSLISPATIEALAREVGRPLDRRRFRANLVIATEPAEAYAEDAWIGGTLVVGDGDEGPALAVTLRDPRCAMLNLDPDSAERDARIFKAVVRVRDNEAGVYATVVRAGRVRMGDPVYLAAPLR